MNARDSDPSENLATVKPFPPLLGKNGRPQTISSDWIVLSKQCPASMHAGHPQVQKPVDSVDPFSNVWLVLLISSASKCTILFRSLWQC
jgi:hypothetical protein